MAVNGSHKEKCMDGPRCTRCYGEPINARLQRQAKETDRRRIAGMNDQLQTELKEETP